MNTDVEAIAAAVLYEGYLLYPYRASALKNRQRWNFGVLYPRSYAERQSGSDTCSMWTECLVEAPPDATLRLSVRFLHLVDRSSEGQSWQGATERTLASPPVRLSELRLHSAPMRVTFPPAENQRPIETELILEADAPRQGLFMIRASIVNATAFEGTSRDEALLQSMVSTHTILRIEPGQFVSLLDPPSELQEAAATCRNVGTWPVLAGVEGQRDTMLSSPVILYDYPQIAPESPGALFDGTEIDEILTLRIMTLTDEEKLAMGAADERAREMLDRIETLPPEQFMKMHGVLRGIRHIPNEPEMTSPDGRVPNE